MDNVRLIDRIMRYHRQYFDGESDCIEVYNKHYTILSDVHMIDDRGRTSVISRDQARKEAAVERCDFCEYLRELRKGVSK